jgi:hypothetical protein
LPPLYLLPSVRLRRSVGPACCGPTRLNLACALSQPAQQRPSADPTSPHLSSAAATRVPPVITFLPRRIGLELSSDRASVPVLCTRPAPGLARTPTRHPSAFIRRRRLHPWGFHPQTLAALCPAPPRETLAERLHRRSATSSPPRCREATLDLRKEVRSLLVPLVVDLVPCAANASSPESAPLCHSLCRATRRLRCPTARSGAIDQFPVPHASPWC